MRRLMTIAALGAAVCLLAGCVSDATAERIAQKAQQRQAEAAAATAEQNAQTRNQREKERALQDLDQQTN